MAEQQGTAARSRDATVSTAESRPADGSTVGAVNESAVQGNDQTVQPEPPFERLRLLTPPSYRAAVPQPAAPAAQGAAVDDPAQQGGDPARGVAQPGTDSARGPAQGPFTPAAVSHGAAPATNGNDAAAVDPDLPRDLWTRLRAGFAMPDSTDPLVQHYRESFAGQQESFARIVERSRRYLYFIATEVERRGMPTEIALLPIVESAFDPRAYSSANASGIWQFIPSTGRIYGMQQNFWYDGRRDIVAATAGALDYLAKLYIQFGSWDLALAAYNCGENCVARAIERNVSVGLSPDFSALSLPQQTRHYVPKLLAVRDLVLSPERFGVSLRAIPDQPYFEAVTTTRQIDLRAAAQLAGISEHEFLQLNPAYNGPAAIGHGTRTILVPAGTAENFSKKLHDPSAKVISWRMHKLTRGERLDRVAGRFGISLAELKRANRIDPGRVLAGGGAILVPVRAEGNTEHAIDVNARPEAEVPAPPPVVHHVVGRGETLGRIAQRYHVSVAQLRAWNRLGMRTGLRAGRVVVIRSADAASQQFAQSNPSTEERHAQHRAAPPRATRYTVKRGDTLYVIAHRLGVAVSDLQRCNRLPPRGRLTAGTVLSLPVSAGG